MAVTTEGVKQRNTAVQPAAVKAVPQSHHQAPVKHADFNHPAGPIKHGGPMQGLRILLFAAFFTISCLL